MTEPLCRWCHKTLEQHLDSRPAGAPVPRMPCTGLKLYFCPAALPPPARRFFAPVFVHHGGVWHHAPRTFPNGGEAACSSGGVLPGQLLALSHCGALTVGGLREAAAEAFGPVVGSSPLCERCFPGILAMPAPGRFGAPLIDLLAKEQP